MNKKIFSIVCGLGIITMTIILIIDVKKTAISYQMHPEASLGVANAVQLTAMIDGTIICIFTVILVLLNIFNKKNK
ncbi:MAG: hypothetical protein J6C46_02095 [Clostridia bacterium]|nr:hypothetical protein [Clostridia bacterium]